MHRDDIPSIAYVLQHIPLPRKVTGPPTHAIDRVEAACLPLPIGAVLRFSISLAMGSSRISTCRIKGAVVTRSNVDAFAGFRQVLGYTDYTANCSSRGQAVRTSLFMSPRSTRAPTACAAQHAAHISLFGRSQSSFKSSNPNMRGGGGLVVSLSQKG